MTEPKITPLARRLAEENGIDWQSLTGTGPDGTIVERDILAFLAKVMAGEVDLPPEPEEAAPPPETIPDISQVQEALAREGVDIGELVPEAISDGASGRETRATAEEVFVEEENFFEVDFEELKEEEPSKPVEEAPIQATPPEPERAAPGGWADAELVEEPASWLEESPATEEKPETGDLEWDETLESLSEPQETALEWESPEPAAKPEPQEPVAREEEASFDKLDFLEEAEPEPSPEPATEPKEPVQEAPAEAGVFSAPDLGPAHEPGVVEETPPPAAVPPPVSRGERAPEPRTAAAFPPSFRRAVSLAAAEQARADLSAAWRSDVPFELLLFRAVDRALADLEVPIRAVLGRFDGESVRSLAVSPAIGLRDLFENLLAANSDGDGMVVLDLGETPYTEVVLPGTLMVSLGRAGLPENLGLISISGELPTDRARFLERIAFYLERPILLA